MLAAGAAASGASASAALLYSRLENGHAARPMNAITHIYDGGEPPAHDGANGRNTLLGFAIHTCACAFWAACHEAVLGRYARRGVPHALASGAAVAVSAYVVDYYVVSPRFRPGIEAYLSGRAMFGVYAALALGFAVTALITAPRNRLRAAPLRRARRIPAARA